MKFVFVADFFADQVLGGGEINNEELINILKKEGHEVDAVNSPLVTLKFLDEYRDYNFIIANFIRGSLRGFFRIFLRTHRLFVRLLRGHFRSFS